MSRLLVLAVLAVYCVAAESAVTTCFMDYSCGGASQPACTDTMPTANAKACTTACKKVITTSTAPATEEIVFSCAAAGEASDFASRVVTQTTPKIVQTTVRCTNANNCNTIAPLAIETAPMCVICGVAGVPDCAVTGAVDPEAALARAENCGTNYCLTSRTYTTGATPAVKVVRSCAANAQLTPLTYTGTATIKTASSQCQPTAGDNFCNKAAVAAVSMACRVCSDNAACVNVNEGTITACSADTDVCVTVTSVPNTDATARTVTRACRAVTADTTGTKYKSTATDRVRSDFCATRPNCNDQAAAVFPFTCLKCDGGDPCKADAFVVDGADNEMCTVTGCTTETTLKADGTVDKVKRGCAPAAVTDDNKKYTTNNNIVVNTASCKTANCNSIKGEVEWKECLKCDTAKCNESPATVLSGTEVTLEKCKSTATPCLYQRTEKDGTLTKVERGCNTDETPKTDEYTSSAEKTVTWAKTCPDAKCNKDPIGAIPFTCYKCDKDATCNKDALEFPHKTMEVCKDDIKVCSIERAEEKGKDTKIARGCAANKDKKSGTCEYKVDGDVFTGTCYTEKSASNNGKGESRKNGVAVVKGSVVVSVAALFVAKFFL